MCDRAWTGWQRWPMLRAKHVHGLTKVGCPIGGEEAAGVDPGLAYSEDERVREKGSVMSNLRGRIWPAYHRQGSGGPCVAVFGAYLRDVLICNLPIITFPRELRSQKKGKALTALHARVRRSDRKKSAPFKLGQIM